MKKKIFFILIIILVAIDQISKYFIVKNKSELPKSIINNILSFNYCENRGIAFGIGEGSVQLISIITIIIIVIILTAIYINYSKIDTKILLGSCLMISGGIGNLIDRIFKLYVVDFIDFNELIKFPIFNFADICVVIGVIIIGIAYLTINKEQTNTR
ncbi:MAG: signal peptidase II [Clostridia bacterium]|nr:signal peptidase II [Clostridia bacterium]